jgi:NADPH:quinone reductase-like Zn-dependent oxidoreductase
LGAVETANYRTTRLREWAETHELVDLMIDPVGRQMLAEAWFCVKGDGALISILSRRRAWRRTASTAFLHHGANGAQLTEISKLLAKQKCRPELDSM